MVELGFKARRAWSRAPPPGSGSVESWVSLYKHSRKSEEPTSWEKPRCRHHCHHHGNRQGVVPLCTGCCVEHWEDKKSSGPTMGLINLTPDPFMLPQMPPLPWSSFCSCPPAPIYNVSPLIAILLLSLLCHLFITFYLVLWLFIYTCHTA